MNQKKSTPDTSPRRISVDVSGDLEGALDEVNKHTGIPRGVILRLAALVYIPRVLNGEFKLPAPPTQGS